MDALTGQYRAAPGSTPYSFTVRMVLDASGILSNIFQNSAPALTNSAGFFLGFRDSGGKFLGFMLFEERVASGARDLQMEQLWNDFKQYGRPER